MLTTIAAAQLPVLILLLAAGTVAKIWTAARGAEPGALSKLGRRCWWPNAGTSPR
ncbi:hypothetical protein ACFQX6_41490 [Streptosporangium lutulentum]